MYYHAHHIEYYYYMSVYKENAESKRKREQFTLHICITGKLFFSKQNIKSADKITIF